MNWSRSRDALGSTPNQVDIDYFGFTTKMSPSRYVELSRGERNIVAKSAQAIKILVSRGGPVMPPVLYVTRSIDGKFLLVTGWDGAHRANLARELGETSIPVDVIVKGIRARNLTPEIKKLPIARLDEYDSLRFGDELANELDVSESIRELLN